VTDGLSGFGTSNAHTAAIKATAAVIKRTLEIILQRSLIKLFSESDTNINLLRQFIAAKALSYHLLASYLRHLLAPQ